MEKMLDLFEEGEAVKDAPNARDLVIRQGGKVEFGTLAEVGEQLCWIADFYRIC